MRRQTSEEERGEIGEKEELKRQMNVLRRGPALRANRII